MRTTHCSLYLPGHTVHYIQGRKVAEFRYEHPDECEPVTVNDLGAGWLEATVDGDTRLGWNHDPDRVTMFGRDSVLGEVLYVPFSGALVSVRSGDGERTGVPVLYPAWGASSGEFDGGGFRSCRPADGPY